MTSVAADGPLLINEQEECMAGTSLRIAGLADQLAAVLSAVESRFAADGFIDDLERQALNDLRGCAVEAEEENGIQTYALGLFRAKATNRRLREMRQDLQGLGIDLGSLPQTA